MKYNKTITRVRSALLVSILAASGLSTGVQSYSLYLQSNNILYYDGSGNVECEANSPGVSLGGSVTNGNKDYKGRQVISDEYLEKIDRFKPIYEQAAKETRIPWQVYAVVHIRETLLEDYNPANGQGVFQDFERVGGPYPPGPVSDAEILRQAIVAGNKILGKIGDNIDLVEKGDPAAIKDLFFSYNGRAAVYTKQANRLGFSHGYEGSPYVMNLADEKRDPAENGDNWGQIKVDLGPIEFPANSDYGAFVMYSALANIPSSSISAACVGKKLGATANGWAVEAMNIYYQDKEPWRSHQYGIGAGSSIAACGCGPTSMAMAISTLNDDPDITPTVMADFFTKNGYINGTCGSKFWNSGDSGPFASVASEYGVTITELNNDLSKAEEAIGRGSFVFMSFVAGSAFGNSGGHIMLLRGVTDSGKYLFADPSTFGEASTIGVIDEEIGYTDILSSEFLSNKTNNEEGYSSNVFMPGINAMYEIRK